MNVRVDKSRTAEVWLQNVDRTREPAEMEFPRYRLPGTVALKLKGASKNTFTMTSTVRSLFHV